MAKSKRSALFFFVAAAFMWPGAGACTFIVDTDELQLGCENDNEKACTDPNTGIRECVLKSLPQYGCGGENCAPCSRPNVKAMRCSPATPTKPPECIFDPELGCASGFKDCDGNPDNGCETSLNRIDSCGACDRKCEFSHATANCEQGRCVLGSCLPGFKDCNNNNADGCETNVKTDPDHCGACDQPCEGTCVDGVCEID